MAVPDPFANDIPHTGDADWARALRAAASAALERLAPPGPRDEDWRFTDIGRIPLASARVPDAATVAPAPVDAIEARVAALGAPSALVVTSPAGTRILRPPAGNGLVVEPLNGAAAGVTAGTLVPAGGDVFTAANACHFDAGVRVGAGRAARPEGPVVLVHWVDGENVASFPRTLVDVAPLAEVDIVELWLSSWPATGSLVVPVTELIVGDGARVTYTSLQDLGEDVVLVANQRACCGRDVRMVTAAAALGAALHRQRVDVDLKGAGCDLEMFGLYVGTDSRHVDFRTTQHHEAERCRSRLLFRGAVGDRSTSIFSGLIRIEANAARSDAHQASHALFLSENARANSIPNLEILNHDVKCGHAASGGPPDLEQVYYLGTRGIDPATAQRLIVDGFFSDVIGRLPLAGVRDFVGTGVFERLGALRGRQKGAA